MATNTAELEKKLNEVFADKAPVLPDGFKKFLVQAAPILALLAGVFSIWTAWVLWHWAHVANGLIGYTNQLCNVYNVDGCDKVSQSRFSLWVWLSIAVLVVEGIIYLLAYSGLRDRKKAGWNYLFYGALVNVAYAVVSLFTDYDKVGHFIGGLIGSAISFYFLFQIRAYYMGKKLPEATPTRSDPKGPAKV